MASGDFDGTIDSTNGGLVKTSDGTLTLSGTAAYTGVTKVEAGTLDVGSTTLAYGELTIYCGAAFASAADQSFSTLNVNVAEGSTATYDGNLSATDGTLNFITSVAPDAVLLTITPNADVPFDIDINLQGFTGKREGFVGGVAFKWFF